MGGSGSGSCSSSGEEDGDADWKAAIDSVSAVATTTATSNGFAAASKDSAVSTDGTNSNQKSQNLKHYQIKAQKLLDDIIENTLVMVEDLIHISDNEKTNEGGIRLFKHAPPGIVFDHMDKIQQPRKRPRILPGNEIDEKSKKFRGQLRSVAVDGVDIMAAARDACQKSVARLEAKDAAAKAAAKREEERVAELKRIRGERWLPSIARERQIKLGRS